MTGFLLDLSGKIDGKTIAALFEIDKIAGALNTPYFIVGATARDILLQYAHNIHTTRATLDIDIGVFVADWKQFQDLRQTLLRSKKFGSTRRMQRLIYQETLPLDILPFGKIAEEKNIISWPSEHEIELSVTGFQECYQHAVSVRLNDKPDLVVKVVNLSGLAVLKLISWNESRERRGKDAADLFIIIKNYISAGNIDRFFDEPDILKEENSDYDRSSARLLGRDIARMTEEETKAKLVAILEREAAHPYHKISMDVLKQDWLRNESYELITAYFNAMLRGLLDC